MFRRDELPVEIAEGTYTLHTILGRGGMATVYAASVELERFDFALPLIGAEAIPGSTRQREARRALRLRQLRARPREELLAEVEAQGLPYPRDGRAAVKVLSEALASQPEVANRFVLEWRSLIAIRCEQLVRVYGGSDSGLLYYAMELVEPLLDKAELAALALPARLELIADGARGLACLHERQLIHRDVKPANLLVYRDAAGEPRAKLADLGIVKDAARTSGLTEGGRVFGTPHFIAPELLIDGSAAASEASDIYALGATLYTLATGQRPYDDASELEVMGKLYQRQPPTPPTALAEIPVEVEQLITWMMAPELAQRPATMAAVLERIEAVGAALGARATRIEAETLPAAKRRPSGAGRAPSRVTRRRSRERAAAAAVAGATSRLPLIAFASLALITLLLVAVVPRGGAPVETATASSANSSSSRAASSPSGPSPPAAESLAELAPAIALARLDRWLAAHPDDEPSAALRQRLLAGWTRDAVDRVAARLRAAIEQRALATALETLSELEGEPAVVLEGARLSLAQEFAALRQLARVALPDQDRRLRGALISGQLQPARERARALRRWAEQLGEIPELEQLLAAVAPFLDDPRALVELRLERERRLSELVASSMMFPTANIVHASRRYRRLRDVEPLGAWLELLPPDPRVLELEFLSEWSEARERHLAAMIARREQTHVNSKGRRVDVRLVGRDDDYLRFEPLESGRGPIELSLDRILWKTHMKWATRALADRADLVGGVAQLLVGDLEAARALLARASQRDEVEAYLGALGMTPRTLVSPWHPGGERGLRADAPAGPAFRRRQALAARGQILARGAALTPAEWASKLEPMRPLTFDQPLRDVACDPQGRWLLVVAPQRVWRSLPGVWEQKGHEVRALAPRRIVSAGPHQLPLIDLGEHSYVFEKTERGLLQQVRNSRQRLVDLAVSPDGQQAATLTASSEIMIWSTREVESWAAAPPPMTVKGARELVWCASLGLVVGGSHGLAWSRRPGTWSRRQDLSVQRLIGFEGPAGDVLVTASPEGQVEVWPTRGGGLPGRAAASFSRQHPIHLAAHPSGQLLLIASPGRLELIETRGWTVIRSLEQAPAKGGAVSLDWHYLFAADGPRLRRWQLPTTLSLR